MSESPEEAAIRAKAEARRKRILERSRNRMNFVNGEYVDISNNNNNNNNENDNENENANNDTKEETQGGGEQNNTHGKDDNKSSEVGAVSEVPIASSTTDGDGAAAAPVVKKSGSAGNLRLQRMRQRRFKKSAAAAAAEKKGEGETSDTTSTKNDDVKKNENESSTTESLNTTEKEPSTESTTTATTSTDNSTGEKKKYLGVARMRRKMIKEKEMQQQKEGGKAGGSSDTNLTSTINSLTGTETYFKLLTGLTRKQRTYKLSVFFQLVMFISLYLIGFMAGFQHTQVTTFSVGESASSPYIAINLEDSVPKMMKSVLSHENLVVLEHSPLVRLFVPAKTPQESNERDFMFEEPILMKRPHIETTDDATTGTYTTSPESSDEFSEFTISETEIDQMYARQAAAAAAAGEIDPIFQVNLDQFTNGPGPVFAAAHVAVKIHRFFLYLIIGIFTWLTQRMTCSPNLFAYAFVLRRISKWVGIASPSEKAIHSPLEEEITQCLAEAGPSDPSTQILGGKDPVAMVTNLVKGFVEGIVPSSLMSLWEVWMDSRQDIYIVACGLFCGMCFSLFSFERQLSDDRSNLLNAMEGTTGIDEL